MSASDPWYFPRTALAVHVLNLYRWGLVRRLALFAPRRKGKTCFALEDLVPAAVADRYFPVYASLWTNVDAPHAPILQALHDSLQRVRGRRIAWKRQVVELQHIGLSAGIASASWRPHVTAAVAAPEDALSQISAALNALVEAVPRGKVLLIIDEAQHLATDARFLPS